MKVKFLYLLCWIYLVQSGQAQTVTFTTLPANGQLYPRTAQSVGLIGIAGLVTGNGAQRLSLVVTRNDLPFRYQQLALAFSANTAPFSTTLTIPAELAQFRVLVFLHRSTDSVLVADRQQFVAGDAYVINGQSNAVAYYSPPLYTYQSDYIRTFGVFTGSDLYNPADTLWATGNTSTRTLVGTWGMELARRLVDQYRIPICLINGGSGGEAIQVFNARNAANPMDLSTNHGRLLYRVNKAGLAGKINAYFYRQGENESSGWSAGWPMNFDRLYQNIRTDYPNLRRFYLFQIHILGGTNEQTGVFRDYQRQISATQPLIRSYATVGTMAYDGVHFGVEGHRQTGLELARIVGQDFYGSTDTTQIQSPNVQKVYYSSVARNELVMQFEEGQKILWPTDTTVRDTYNNPAIHQMPTWVYLDRISGSVAVGRAEGHRVLLTLRANSVATQLGYLPPNYPSLEGGIPFPPGFARAFPGPFLTNERGLRAFAFWNVPISNPLAPLTGLVINSTNDLINLNWTDHPTELQYDVERRSAGESSFRRLARLPTNTTVYTDSTAWQSGVYEYRLRAVTAVAETTIDASIIYTCRSGPFLISTGSGNWQQPQIWQCRNVPVSTDNVEISGNQVVTLQQPVVSKRIRLKGILLLKAGGSVQFTR